MTDETKRFAINIPADLHRRFKVATVEQGDTMQGVMIDAAKRYVKEFEEKRKDK